jgi:hypothetical protein
MKERAFAEIAELEALAVTGQNGCGPYLRHHIEAHTVRPLKKHQDRSPNAAIARPLGHARFGLDRLPPRLPLAMLVEDLTSIGSQLHGTGRRRLATRCKRAPEEHHRQGGARH